MDCIQVVCLAGNCVGFDHHLTYAAIKVTSPNPDSDQGRDKVACHTGLL